MGLENSYHFRCASFAAKIRLPRQRVNASTTALHLPSPQWFIVTSLTSSRKWCYRCPGLTTKYLREPPSSTPYQSNLLLFMWMIFLLFRLAGKPHQRGLARTSRQSLPFLTMLPSSLASTIDPRQLPAKNCLLHLLGNVY